MSVVVIGCGLAGATAAARLSALHVPVTVVADRPGATVMHGGGWYLGLNRLPRYGLASPRIGEALELLSGGLDGELELDDGPFALTDTGGVRRLVDLAPRNHARAASFQAPFAVADLAPVGHPFAQMQPAGTPVTVEYPRWPGAFDRSFAAVAARLEQPDEQAVLTEALATALEGRGFTALLLPPVLGLENANRIRVRLEEALGIPVAEALGTAPSTPGLRLEGALRRWLSRLEVPVRRARVTAVDRDGRVVHLGEARLDADAVVFATGGVVPGGVEIGLEAREPLAGLRVDPLPIDLLTAVRPDRPYGGALFRVGVSVDRCLRPIGHDGEPVHPRLFAVGDLLAGPDNVGDRCSSGRAVLSGYLAAEHVSEAVG